jgi:hypothetical protein
VARWSGGQVGARWRTMITIKIRFRSRELFAQGKLLLSGGLVFIIKKKYIYILFFNRFLEVFLGIL